MKNSKLSILLLGMVMILAISAVSAADTNDTSDSVAQAVDEAPVEEVASNVDALAATDNTDVLADVGNNFTSLQSSIDTGTVVMDKDYARVEGESTLSISKDVTIEGNGHKIDGSNLGGIFNVNSGCTLTLNGVTLINGNSQNGAAVYVNDGAVLIANAVNFIDNIAVDNGGAIYATGATVNLTRCTLDANDVTEIKTNDESGGAAIYVINSNLTIRNSKITNNGNKSLNRTNNDLVNGVLNLQRSTTVITDSLFENNTGIYGGAIIAQSDDISLSSLTISGTNFTKNVAYTGGAIYTTHTKFDISDCFFTDNNKAIGIGSPGYCSGGGAIIIMTGSVANVYNITVKGSVAAQGGAVSTQGSRVSIEKSTFEDNSALITGGKNGFGGAVYLDGPSIVDNCTFKNNYAESNGGAIRVNDVNGASITIKNVICDSNRAGNGGAIAVTDFNVTISDSEFTNNEATVNGGAIYFTNWCTYGCSVNNSSFTDNTAGGEGNAIFGTSKSKISLSNNTLAGSQDIVSEGEVTKDGSNVTISPIENVTYGTPVVVYYKIVNRTNNVTVSVRLLVEGPQPDIENLNYTIDDEKVTIYGLGVGEYEIQIANIEDNNYDASADIELFNITKANPNLKVTAKVNEFGIIEINVAGDKALTGNVTFKVINETGAVVSEYTEEIVNGAAEFGELQTYAKGKYNYTVDFKDNKGNYNDTFIKSETPLVVDKEIPELSVNTTVNEFGHIVVVANVTKGANGTINFLIIDSQGKQISVNKTLVNSTASYNELTPFAKGEYQVIVTYNGDNAYYSIFAKDVANVTKIAPAMDYTVKVVGGEVNITVTLPAAINGNLTVTYPSGFVENFTIKNGTANIYYVSMNKTGDLAITASFAGNDQYYAVEEIIGFTIKQATLIKVNPTVSVVYNNNAKVTVKLTNLVTNKVIAGATIEITVNGKNYKGTTDKDGKAVITIPAKMVPKKYTANVAFKGTDKLEADINQFKLTVKKATPKVTAKKKTFKKSIKVKKYAIALKDNKGKAIKKAKVTIKVGKKTFKATTNSKGKAVFKLKKLTKKAKYNAKVTYKGNKYFNKVTKKVKITIK